MDGDKETVDYLNREFDKVKESEVERLERNYAEYVAKMKPSKELLERDYDNIRQNYMSLHEPDFNERLKVVEARMYQDYGGSREAAEKMIQKDPGLKESFNDRNHGREKE